MPKRLTTEDFIKRAVEKHGSLYDYSKSVYVNAETKICIKCRVHGEFYQLPIFHIYGCGCKSCANDNLKKPGMSTEEFISRAKIIHGTSYDYSKAVYKNVRTKVCIICTEHGKFFQRPKGHLAGRGCLLCLNDNKKYTLEQVIKKADVVHNKKYNYEESIYNGFKEKICIICPIHGKFFQKVKYHLEGYGCPTCGKIKSYYTRKYDTISFIKKAMEIHGKDKFDYSKIEYNGPKNKVVIICKIHGEFIQGPFNHLRGNECIKCSYDKQKLTLENFILNSNTVHGTGKYDYSKIKVLKDGRKKVCIICPIHGEFRQIAEAHSLGHGCKKCGHDQLSKDRALSRDEFIRRAKKVHKDLYDYSKVKYKNSITKVIIICKIHGEFYQKPGIHVRSRGCPQCMHSLGERVIIDWFTKKNIEFKHHYSFPDLVSPEKKPLVFDFYTIREKFLIEYDGEQHYRPVRFNSISEERAIDKFKKVQYYDSLKNQYCEKNNIPLLRIPYNKFKEIPEILTEKILKQEVLK